MNAGKTLTVRFLHKNELHISHERTFVQKKTVKTLNNRVKTCEWRKKTRNERLYVFQPTILPAVCPYRILLAVCRAYCRMIYVFFCYTLFFLLLLPRMFWFFLDNFYDIYRLIFTHRTQLQMKIRLLIQPDKLRTTILCRNFLSNICSLLYE